MKLKHPAILAFLVSGLLFGAFVLIPASWLQPNWSHQKLLKQQVANSDNVIKGSAIQHAMLKDKNFYPVYGSSELRKDDPYQPVILLKGKKPDLFYVGTGGQTDLLQAIALGAQYDQLKNKKMTIIISPQWFTRKGMLENNYLGRVSKVQINRYFDNPNIPNHLKQRLAQRLLHFKTNKHDDFLKQVAKTGEVKGHYLNPFYANHLEKMEILKSYIPMSVETDKLTKLLDKSKPNTKSYAQLDKEAEKYGKSRSSTNPYRIKDEYWKLIKQNKRPINRQHEFHMNSPEFKDLALLVDLMKAGNADVQYVVLPVNGKWYDSIHVDRERRQKVDEKIVKTISSHGGNVYDMTDQDYKPYVMSDAVHIGWRGLVELTEKIEKHIHS
ncbi:poly D-alanine transfer protein DltD [Staphylococcus agnetis]|uniref:D-alanyl-lipoteichoic acid biosynthesis protein DltD n=1 Tax=Staphylococcus agnetis TaxID=985762 RepID=UPI000DFC8047|nr:D-alanyl-lipoteichoic acid biosynthesis protein DltD [Staphylococcus agnetis]SUK16829.1 poly D-alanine transfer protein DltD [Staphylococcus agnetis]